MISKRAKIEQIKELANSPRTPTAEEIKLLKESPCADYINGEVIWKHCLNTQETPSKEVQRILNKYLNNQQINFTLNFPTND
jgi:hypothetical protein